MTPAAASRGPSSDGAFANPRTRDRFRPAARPLPGLSTSRIGKELPTHADVLFAHWRKVRGS